MTGRRASASGNCGETASGGERSGNSERRGQPLDADPVDQLRGLGAVDRARTEVLGGLGAAGDAVGEAILDRMARPPRGDEAGQESIAGADAGDGGERLDRRLVVGPGRALAEGEAAADDGQA